MTTLREAAQMALDYLDAPSSKVWAAGTQYKIIQALRAGLAQPDLITPADVKQLARIEKLVEDVDPYTAPPQREWQGLTDEEMMVAAFQAGFDVHEDYDNEDDPDALHWWSEDGEPCDDTLHKLRDIIEAKLREKNFDRPS